MSTGSSKDMLVEMLFEEREMAQIATSDLKAANRRIEELEFTLKHLDADFDRLRNKHADEVIGLTNQLEDQIEKTRRLSRANDDLRAGGVDFSTGAKIAFIKLIREVSGEGLKQSKQWVDEFIESHTLKPLE